MKEGRETKALFPRLRSVPLLLSVYDTSTSVGYLCKRSFAVHDGYVEHKRSTRTQRNHCCLL